MKARLALFLAVALCWFNAASVRAAVTRHKLAANKLAANKLAANKLAANKLAANKLAANALSSTSLEADASAAELLSTPEGRDVYAYLISCALPAGITIEATVPGAADSEYCTQERCVFAGALGLAEGWIDHKLAAKDEGWVSACVLARVNFHEEAEAVSLRGPHPSLTVSADEAELYTVQEGAFFGNLFTHEADPIDWNACRGEGQASGEFGGLALRDCAEEDPANPGKTYCGFNYAGDCADFTPEVPSPYACKYFDSAQGAYTGCHTAPGNGNWPKLQTYREVITVYVTAD